ncbi:MAG: ammonium transporter [Sporocytophaga sp.]|uniref:ammonium transporter n=1 Tax=Sporocytophaga sp. TaxID=2231183 RepID=UPI001B060F39|nr:ammonium transporter [Sporocytophaga sp.]MBO9700262.1 ammonium transporter [Sporocytophaga sp.]
MNQPLLDTSATEAIDSTSNIIAVSNDSLFTNAEIINSLKAEIAGNALLSNNLWMMVATALMFIMHLGFATIESGLSRSKNTTNILFKNTIIPAMGILIFGLWGYNLMYPGSFFEGNFIGFSGFGIAAPEDNPNAEASSYTFWSFFLFQAMFAATATTIVSGAVAERIKIWSFILFSFLLVGIIYPIIGFWAWGGGFLQKMDIQFYDFAGSTVVHSVGGWSALAGVIVLGPRIGKYVDNRIIPLPGHSMPLATIGAFLLWFGWFGFNGGSVLSANPKLVSLVLVTTCLSASAGAIGALTTSFITTRTIDHSMVLNGILGGLVAITAGADKMNPSEAIIIGLTSGSLVVLAVLLFDKLRIDDPVGAISVHLICGIFGTLAVGFMGDLAETHGTKQLISQAIGITSTGLFVFPITYFIFILIDKTIGLRVTAKEELEGLDIGIHGMRAYHIDNAK